MEGVFSPSICCSYKEGTITHTYDNQSHLLKAAGDTTYTYTYDDAGNILTANGHTYTYGDANWKDLLTAFDGNSISYDAIGNPTSYYNGTRWNFTWANGRSLATATDGTNNLSFTYDTNGLRTSKKVGSVTHKYLYASGKLMRETYGGNTLDFFYDANGTPYALKYNGTVYYYVTNLQGDVIRVVDASGNTVASYDYDPYGKVISATGSLAGINPIRYRGYYYDTETGFYYLQSRYYDPVVGRFISADSYTSTAFEILANNMYAYCENNPIDSEDQNGEFVLSAILTKVAVATGKAVLGASVNVLATFIAAKVTGQSYTWQDAGVAALSGALGTGKTAMKIAAGIVSGVYSGYMAYQNGASLGGAILSGVASAYGTTVSVANISGWMGTDLSIFTSTFSDLVFGTGANSISAAIYRCSVESPKSRSTLINMDTSVGTTTIKQSDVKKSQRSYEKMIAYKRLTIMEQLLSTF